jgi:hypothetical protein
MEQWKPGNYGWLSTSVLENTSLTAYDKIVLTFVRTFSEIQRKKPIGDAQQNRIVELPPSSITSQMCGLPETTTHDALHRLAHQGFVKLHEKLSRRRRVEILPVALVAPSLRFDWMICSRHDIKPVDRIVLMDVCEWASSDRNPTPGRDSRNVHSIAARCGIDVRSVQVAILHLSRDGFIRLQLTNHFEARIPCVSMAERTVAQPQAPKLFQPPPDLLDEDAPELQLSLDTTKRPQDVTATPREKQLEERVAELEQQLAAKARIQQLARRVAELEQQLASEEQP